MKLALNSKQLEKAIKLPAEEIQAKLGFLADGSDASVYLKAFLKSEVAKDSPLEGIKIIIAAALAAMLNEGKS